MVVVNDISSWMKERRQYDSGEFKRLINAVEVMKQYISLSSYDAAKAMTYAFQLQLECDIDIEIQRLLVANDLTADEWLFIDSMLFCAAGHVMASGTMLRYGGEKSRLS
jgi:hypothetical protein